MRTTLTLIFVSLILSFTSTWAYVNQGNSVNALTNIQKINNRGIAGKSKIEGKWVGKISGQQGDIELTFNFKVDGDSLTGTNSSSMGENNLTNGVVDGNNFSFDVDAQGMKISHKCKYLDDDTIEVKVLINDQEMVMKLTRVTQ